MPLTTDILAILTAAPAEIAAVASLYAAVKDALGSTDQAAIEAAIARLDLKTAADVARLDADAAEARAPP